MLASVGDNDIVEPMNERCGINGSPCCIDTTSDGGELGDPKLPASFCYSGICVIDSLHPFPGICMGGDGGGGGDDGGGSGGGYPGGGYDDVSRPCLPTIIWKDVCDDDTVGLFWDGNDEIADPSRPVVLLVHGTKNDCRTWQDYYGYLKNDGFRIAVVNLYPSNHDADAKGCRFRGPMFEPNGQLLDFLIDTLYSFLVNNYPSGWNNDIVIVAHSRGALESEVAIYKYGNTHVRRVVTIGGPFFGSKLADVCSSPSDIEINCDVFPIWSREYWECQSIKTILETFNITVGNVCAYFTTPDVWRLSTDAVIPYRSNYIDPYMTYRSVNYYVGIGWTPHWSCGPFPGKSQAGCLLLRYGLWQGCNDGTVEYSSTSRRASYPNTCFISTRAVSQNPFPWSCGGDPSYWEKDHTSSKNDVEIYNRYVKRAILGNCPTLYQVSDSTEPMDIPITSPKESGSNMFIVGVEGSLYLPISSETDSIIVISPYPLNIMYASRVREFDIEGLYGYIVSPQSTGANILLARKSDEFSTDEYDFTPVMVFYPSPHLAKVKFNKRMYLEGDVIRIDFVYPLADSVKGSYFRIGDPNSIKFITFREINDTFKAYVRIPFRGVYRFVFTTFGREPRTIMENVWVVPSYDTDALMSFISDMEYGRFGIPKRSVGSRQRLLYGGEVINIGLRGNYRIYDVKGSLVLRGYTGDGRIDIRRLPRGIYFVVIRGKIFKVVRR